MRPALASIYTDSICSDLTVSVNGAKSFKVNKCILAVRSQPFNSLIRDLEGDRLELDCDYPDLFETLLVWLYSTSIDMPCEVGPMVQLLFLAQDFQVLDLMARCESELINKLTCQNVVDVLTLLYPH